MISKLFISTLRRNKGCIHTCEDTGSEKINARQTLRNSFFEWILARNVIYRTKYRANAGYTSAANAIKSAPSVDRKFNGSYSHLTFGNERKPFVTEDFVYSHVRIYESTLSTHPIVLTIKLAQPEYDVTYFADMCRVFSDIVIAKIIHKLFVYTLRNVRDISISR